MKKESVPAEVFRTAKEILKTKGLEYRSGIPVIPVTAEFQKKIDVNKQIYETSLLKVEFPAQNFAINREGINKGKPIELSASGEDLQKISSLLSDEKNAPLIEPKLLSPEVDSHYIGLWEGEKEGRIFIFAGVSMENKEIPTVEPISFIFPDKDKEIYQTYPRDTLFKPDAHPLASALSKLIFTAHRSIFPGLNEKGNKLKPVQFGDRTVNKQQQSGTPPPDEMGNSDRKDFSAVQSASLHHFFEKGKKVFTETQSIVSGIFKGWGQI